MNYVALDQEARDKRAKDLAAKGINGMDYLLVEINTTGGDPVAELSVYFFNGNVLSGLTVDLDDLNEKFKIQKKNAEVSGETESLCKIIDPFDVAVSFTPPSSFSPGDLFVIDPPNVLTFLVAPVGDYSTYTLTVDDDDIDPFFNSVDFKFRPGCFNNNCAPSFKKLPAPGVNPKINYLAKDFHSFKHTMINAMKERVAGWEPTSEADFDVTLLELFSAAADELSDFQDRVMNEAWLTNARKRVSLARHARLVDYHIHQGNQASGVLALKVEGIGEIENTGAFCITTSGADSVWFKTDAEYYFHEHLSEISIYTWSGSITALKAGATSADLKINTGALSDAQKFCNRIKDGSIKRLLIQEEISPATGSAAGRDINKREIVHLKKDAEWIHDKLTGDHVVRVNWEGTGALLYDYCTLLECPEDFSATETGISLFYGNLVDVSHGQPLSETFLPPLDEGENPQEGASYYEVKIDNSGKEYALCTLDSALLYQETPLGGEVPPRSALEVQVDPAGVNETWEEQIDLTGSDSNDPHFIVETDELGISRVRFGNGTNGCRLPEGVEVVCNYQSGYGPNGNIGADSLVEILTEGLPEDLQLPSGIQDRIIKCWNPLSLTNGRAPEPASEIIRKAPEAFNARQLRAVTLSDYVKRAEELPEVSHAAASYSWSGSRRVVRVVVDPSGSTNLSPAAYKKIFQYLSAVKLIGDDLEIRPPRFVPLEILVTLCIKPEFWKDDIEFLLGQNFSDDYTHDGRLAFFHPDRWTFGQSLRAVEIIGEIMKIPELDHVISVEMKRRGQAGSSIEKIDVNFNEIILVKSDPAHVETGIIQFDVQGGRR